MSSQLRAISAPEPRPIRSSDREQAELTSGAVPAARLMQWIDEDEAAVDFAVLWASIVVPVASLVDWRMTAIVAVPVVIRLAQRRVALRRLMLDGVSSGAIQQALQWVEQHADTPRPVFGALRARAHSGWRSWIAKRYVAPFVEVDAYQLLAEREVKLMAAGGRQR